MSDARTTGATNSQLRQEAADVVDDVKAEGAGVAEAAKNQALGFAEEQKQRGAEHAEGIARAVHGAADQLQESSPQIARYVQEAASAVDGLARSLRDSSPGQLMGQMENLARRQPVAFFGAAVLAGFALARFAKSSAEEARHAGAQATLAQGGRHADAAIGGGRVVPHSTAMGAPGWVQRGPDDAPRPATVAAASLGGAAARTTAQAGQTSPIKDAG
ncbi:hypothetical protein ACFQS7_29510 [Dankookia sp. GCM10030260]|uniref:hypothetical protein n=1 Tax=Dankookia sp. GCM10030260 TaxID=3273390 RepID=UPI003609B316